MSLLCRQMSKVLLRTSRASLCPHYGYAAPLQRAGFTQSGVRLNSAPPVSVPYAQAIKTEHAIYCSGQLPVDVDGNLVEGTIEDRAAACMRNLTDILTKAGSSVEKIVKVQIYLTDMNDLEAVNTIYTNWVRHKPARACVQVAALPKGVDVEIDCIALPGHVNILETITKG